MIIFIFTANYFSTLCNDNPSIVKLLAVARIVITPVKMASSSLAKVLGLTPTFGPTIVKLANEMVTFSLYSPAKIIILLPSLASSKAATSVG